MVHALGAVADVVQAHHHHANRGWCLVLVAVAAQRGWCLVLVAVAAQRGCAGWPETPVINKMVLQFLNSGFETCFAPSTVGAWEQKYTPNRDCWRHVETPAPLWCDNVWLAGLLHQAIFCVLDAVLHAGRFEGHTPRMIAVVQVTELDLSLLDRDWVVASDIRLASSPFRHICACHYMGREGFISGVHRCSDLRGGWVGLVGVFLHLQRLHIVHAIYSGVHTCHPEVCGRDGCTVAHCPRYI